MSRVLLYDRLRADPVRAAWGIEVGVAGMLRDARVVDVTQVAEYFGAAFAAHGEPLDLRRDLPLMAPPFPRMFCEYERPATTPGSRHDLAATGGQRVGLLLLAHERPASGWAGHDIELATGAFAEQLAGTADPVRPPRWAVELLLFTASRQFGATGPGAHWLLGVADDGGIALRDDGKPFWLTLSQALATSPAQVEAATSWSETAYALAAPVLLAVCFMHVTKGVRLRDDPPVPAKVAARHERSHGTPLARSQTLVVDQFTSVLERARAADSSGDRSLRRALHLVRGHFATYTPDAPLFGRHVGSFFVPAHARGSGTRGVVLSEYDTRAPTDSSDGPDLPPAELPSDSADPGRA